MTDDEYKFLKTSFDRIEILLTRIATACEKKRETRKIEQPCEGALKLANVWNEYKDKDLPAVNGLNARSARHKNASARWKEKPDEEHWIRVVQRINFSKFCLGDNERGWLADFEFLVRPDTHHRVLEGKYDRCHSSFKKETAHQTRIVGYTSDGTPVTQTVKN